jgi:hypothetical protein
MRDGRQDMTAKEFFIGARTILQAIKTTEQNRHGFFLKWHKVSQEAGLANKLPQPL